MKRFAAVVCLVGLAAFAAAAAGKPEYDLIIRNGRVLDGAGNPWVHEEVAIRGDRIVKIARHISGSARRVIDAHDQIVSPGFIDMHTHSDMTLLTDGTAQSKIRQGVTTEILGEAASVAPVCPAILKEAAASPLGENTRAVRRDWKDFDGYYRKLLRKGTSVNVASYVGLSTVRMCGVGPEMRDPTPAELGKEIQIVGQAMRQGAIGLSSGLIYPPGSYAKTDEIVALAKVAAQYGGIYTSHIRHEGNELLDAIDETLTIAEQAHIPVHILHIKATGPNSTQNAAAAIARIADARARGMEVTADQYPYIASSTGLATHVPEWAQDGGTVEFMKRLRDPETRAKLRVYVAQNSNPEKMVIASLHQPGNKRLEGMTIGEAAKARNEDPSDTVLNLLGEENGRIGMVFFTMKEDDVRNFMKQPWVSFGSDGTAVRPDGPLGQGKPHPRYYGSNVRVLGRYVREDHVITLEDAVRKMTSLAAEQLGIHDRGLIAEGMKADVVVFDPDRVIDKATFKDPHQYAEGVNYVVVNGKVVIDQGQHTGKKPGQVIYGPGRVAARKPAR